MAAGLTVLAVVVLLGGVALVAILRKGDVKTTFKIPLVATFTLEARDKRPK